MFAVDVLFRFAYTHVAGLAVLLFCCDCLLGIKLITVAANVIWWSPFATAIAVADARVFRLPRLHCQAASAKRAKRCIEQSIKIEFSMAAHNLIDAKVITDNHHWSQLWERILQLLHAVTHEVSLHETPGKVQDAFIFRSIEVDDEDVRTHLFDLVKELLQTHVRVKVGKKQLKDSFSVVYGLGFWIASCVKLRMLTLHTDPTQVSPNSLGLCDSVIPHFHLNFSYPRLLLMFVLHVSSLSHARYVAHGFGMPCEFIMKKHNTVNMLHRARILPHDRF